MNNKKLSQTLSFILSSSFSLLLPKLALAVEWTNLYDPNPDTKGGPGAATFGNLEVIFQNILGLLIPFAGVAIFVMILVGGFKYLTSAGYPKATASASQIITWAIIGLLFLIGAWLVLLFIGEITGVDVTIFKVIVQE